jgi:hypothetical protein
MPAGTPSVALIGFRTSELGAHALYVLSDGVNVGDRTWHGNHMDFTSPMASLHLSDIARDFVWDMLCCKI